MKKKLPLTFTYDEVATILKVDRRTIYNLVGNEVSERKPLKRVGAKSGFRATITSDSVLQMFIKKYEVNEEKAVESILDRLHGKESSEEAKVEKSKGEIPAKKTVKPTDAMKPTSDISSGKELHGEAPDASDEKGTPATPDSSSVIYINSSGVEGKNQKDSMETENPEEEDDTRPYDMWMYTIPFYDRNPEFDVPPEEVMKLGTTDDYSRRLDFIANSFMEVCSRDGKKQVEAVVVTFCKSEGTDQPSPTKEKGYYHFHALVLFNLKLKRGTAKNKFGASARLDPVKKGHLQAGKFVSYRNPVQGCLDYIRANGRFEGRKTERCIGHTERGIEKLQSIVNAEKKAFEEKIPKTVQIVNAAKSGESRKDILAAHPTYNNPTGIEAIRFAQQYETWKAMGFPKTRDVRVMLVLGDVRTGKTKSIIDNLSSSKYNMATFSENEGLETYEAQAVMQVDHPHPRWCPPDLLEKMLSSNIIQIPVRGEGSVVTLWKWVVIEAKSIQNFESTYGATAVRDLLKYIDKIRYCFIVETTKVGPTLFQEGYAKEAAEGVSTRLDYVDFPVSRGIFRTRLGEQEVDDNLVMEISRMYFDVTRIEGEIAPELERVEKTKEYIEITNRVFWYLRKEIVEYSRKDVIPAIMEICKRIAKEKNPDLPLGRVPYDGPDL